MENDNKKDLNEQEDYIESLKPRWWKPLWILTAISIVVSGFFSYFFLQSNFVRIIIIEIIFGIVLGIAYYIRIKPNIKINKAVYILLGITPIGFGLCLLYGLIGISRLLVSLGSWWIYLNIINFITLLTIGGFIGNWIGKKRNYYLPLSLKSETHYQKE
ncbi:MAG: hypothetical protein ACFFC3_07330 [Candidatus Odinarchaeota archaeon]